MQRTNENNDFVGPCRSQKLGRNEGYGTTAKKGRNIFMG